MKSCNGDPKTAFDNPYSIAISKSLRAITLVMAIRSAGHLTAGAYSQAVTLVFDDLPENTHLKYTKHCYR